MAYPVLANTYTWYSQGGTTISRDTFTEINIVDSYVPTGEETISWDASTTLDGSIMVYVNGDVLTIAGNGSGKIGLNSNSSYLFSTPIGKRFTNVTNINGLDLLDSSNVTNFEYAFWSCSSLVNINLNSWDVSKVYNAGHMFCGCDVFTTLDIGMWNTETLSNADYMFYSCDSLRNLDVKNWDTSRIKNMEYMFGNCKALTTIDVSKWNTSSVTDMSNMFDFCEALTTLDVSKWNTSSVTTMHEMFSSCKALTTLDVSKWNVSKVWNMYGLFYNCKALTTLDVSNWNVSSATRMSFMFAGCTSLTTLDVSNWNVEKVTEFQHMFTSNIDYSNSMKIKLDVSKWNTSSATNMSFMFYGCGSAQPDVSNWDVSKVKNFDHMFAHSAMKTPIDVSRWNTSSATNMGGMFHTVQAEVIDVSSFDTSNVINFGQMFEYCSKLTKIIGLENFDTSKGVDFQEMFNGCSKLKELDLSSFDTRNAKDGVSISTNGGKSGTLQNMFADTVRLEKIVLGENFSFNGDGTTTSKKGVFPTPNSDYIKNADGNWYNEEGQVFVATDIPSLVADIYYAVPRRYRYSDGMLIQYASLEAIANAIREKTGDTNLFFINDIIEIVPRLYDVGAQTQQYEFMAEYQRYKEYIYKYGTSGWNDTTFFPVQDDIVTGSAQGMFRDSNISNIKKAYEDKGLKLDFSGATGMQLCFCSAGTTELGIIDMSNNTANYGASECFAYNGALVRIEKLIANPKIYWSSSFAGCTKLEEIIFAGEIGSERLNLKDCKKLNVASIESLFGNENVTGALSDTTTGLTITLPTTAKETYYNTYSTEYTDVDEAWNTLIAKKSNWTVALA